MPDERRYIWVAITGTQWSLIDESSESGVVIRHIQKLGLYLGKPKPIYRLFLDDGYSNHGSLDQAMDTGIAPLS